MASMHVRLKVALVGVVLSTSIVSTQQAMRPESATPKVPQAARPAQQSALGAAQTSARDVKSLISGVALDSNQAPIPNAVVRLRNLDRNEIEQIITASNLGEFSFVAQPNVPYVVEIVDQAGRVLAVGDVIVANAGEVAGASVALPSRLPALAGVFGDTASSIMSAAFGIGLTVVDPALPKVSPTR